MRPNSSARNKARRPLFPRELAPADDGAAARRRVAKEAEEAEAELAERRFRSATKAKR